MLHASRVEGARPSSARAALPSIRSIARVAAIAAISAVLVGAALRSMPDAEARAEARPAPPRDASAAPAAIASARAPLGPATIPGPGGAPIFVRPPATIAPGGASIMLVLHGMCSDPGATCDAFERQSSASGDFLVCPTGNGDCRGLPDWAGSPEDKARHLDAVLAAVREAYGGAARDDGVLLAGFSRGAFVARDVVYARPGRYRALVLLGAITEPDPARLAASGIARVVLASGRYDGARRAMQRDAARLAASGIPARFLDLGPFPHALPADAGDRLAPDLAWVAGE